ncbi:MAG: hypothetical protein CMM58_04790 [Rhodospirillaceae bacterium]|nr:hypothetical protein [Rhodospirillaceae bacterium]|tara:strand:- start:324 stop:821 length:498 start_codon:yes stop_codon:yes gene_type:complete
MKKLLIIFILPLVLLIGAGAGAFFYGLIPGLGPAGNQQSEEEIAEKEAEKRRIVPEVYQKASVLSLEYWIDDFVVNLQTQRPKPVYLLLTFVLILSGEEAKSKVQLLEPRIRSAANVFLSSLSPSDLDGYEGVTMLRQELWRLVNKIVNDSTSVENVQILKMSVK